MFTKAFLLNKPALIPVLKAVFAYGAILSEMMELLARFSP